MMEVEGNMQDSGSISDSEKNLAASFLKQHKTLYTRTLWLTSLSILLAIGYFISKNSVFVPILTSYLAAVMGYSKFQNNHLAKEYRKIELNRLDEVRKLLSNIGIDVGNNRMAFGYQIWGKEIQPVFVCATEQNIYVFKNIYQRNLIIKMGREMIFLFPVIKKALTQPIFFERFDKIKLELSSMTHFDFLYEAQSEFQKPAVFESYIYDSVLRDILEKNKKSTLSTNLETARMRKEKMYKLEVDDLASEIYLSNQAVKRLQIIC